MGGVVSGGCEHPGRRRTVWDSWMGTHRRGHVLPSLILPSDNFSTTSLVFLIFFFFLMGRFPYKMAL